MPQPQIYRRERQIRRHGESATLWVAANRGVMTRVAEHLGVTPQYVAQVLRGKRRSRGGRVERALKRRGAPTLGVMEHRATKDQL